MAITKAKEKPGNDLTSGMSTSGGTCVVAKGTTIEGSFAAQADVRLDGTIKGDVRCSKRIVVGETGTIEGSLHAEDAVVMGRIEGELVIRGTLSLKPSAFILGSIIAQNMAVEEGAQYSGECKVGPKS